MVLGTIICTGTQVACGLPLGCLATTPSASISIKLVSSVLTRVHVILDDRGGARTRIITARGFFGNALPCRGSPHNPEGVSPNRHDPVHPQPLPLHLQHPYLLAASVSPVKGPASVFPVRFRFALHDQSDPTGNRTRAPRVKVW